MIIGIFTGGKITDGKALQKALKEINFTIAADSGAKNAIKYHSFPHVTIGDFDSLDDKTREILKKNHCEMIAYPTEKNETDTELALAYALTKKPAKIILFGALNGDRMDHVLANLFLPLSQNNAIVFVDGQTTVQVVKGPQILKFAGYQNDLLSLIPITPTVTNVITKNLSYPLKSETLLQGKTRGISNVFSKDRVMVNFTKGTLLVIHTAVT